MPTIIIRRTVRRDGTYVPVDGQNVNKQQKPRRAKPLRGKEEEVQKEAQQADKFHHGKVPKSEKDPPPGQHSLYS